MARLPVPGSDSGTWGSILNDFLEQTHNTDGSLKTNVVNAASIADATITEAKLDSLVQAKLNVAAGVTSVNSQTGAVTLTKSDIGLTNVDNTSDATKNSAVATLTNKTISGASNTLSNIPQSAVTNLATDLSAKANDSLVVHSSGTETVAGVKTFSSSPVVPAPSAGGDVANKTYVDSVVGGGGPVLWGGISGTLSGQTDLQSALDAKADSSALSSYLPTSQKGAVNGVASLDAGGKVPLAQLPASGGAVTSVNSQTGDVTLTKSDIGLTNVDNTSDATKNSAVATLTNKTISGASNTLSNIPQSAVTSLATDLAAKVDDTISVSGTQSLSGGGTLTANRTIALVNDSATPGNSKYYGTNGAGAKGFYDLPSGGSGGGSETFTSMGTLSVGVGGGRLYNDSGTTRTISAVRATVATAPTGSGVIVDVNLGGSTIFPTQSERPTIAVSQQTSGSVARSTSWANGAYLTVDVDQIGSTIAGADLTVTITFA